MGGHARDQYQTTGESAGSVPDSFQEALENKDEFPDVNHISNANSTRHLASDISLSMTTDERKELIREYCIRH